MDERYWHICVVLLYAVANAKLSRGSMGSPTGQEMQWEHDLKDVTGVSIGLHVC